MDGPHPFPLPQASPDPAGDNHLASSVQFKTHFPNTFYVLSTAKYSRKISFNLYKNVGIG